MTPAPAGARLAAFAARAEPPAAARASALAAIIDTLGVTIAGASEPVSRLVRETVTADGTGPCSIVGTGARASAAGAALANGTAAHALDFDDMCFVSLAHPSAPLVPAILAAAERAGASGRRVLDAYAIGFEVQALLGRAMNPRHYRRGWHCTSTLGAVSAAAGVARVLGLDPDTTARAIGIAASSASGLKENFGTMVKPLHAGLAAQAGLRAADLAARGLTSSAAAIDGPQGFLAAMDSERTDLSADLDRLGSRWEILDTGITVKLYPSCAGTHPAIDTLIDLRREAGFGASDVAHLEIGVDAVTPTILLYNRPASGLEAKFSMPFCAAAAVVHGRVGIDSFEPPLFDDQRLDAMMPRVAMRVDPTLDATAPALTQTRVTVHLTDGRVLTRLANGARGYPDRPARPDELDAKFLACARRALPAPAADAALRTLRGLEAIEDVRALRLGE